MISLHDEPVQPSVPNLRRSWPRLSSSGPLLCQFLSTLTRSLTDTHTNSNTFLRKHTLHTNANTHIHGLDWLRNIVIIRNKWPFNDVSWERVMLDRSVMRFFHCEWKNEIIDDICLSLSHTHFIDFMSVSYSRQVWSHTPKHTHTHTVRLPQMVCVYTSRVCVCAECVAHQTAASVPQTCCVYSNSMGMLSRQGAHGGHLDRLSWWNKRPSLCLQNQQEQRPMHHSRVSFE